MTELQHAKQCHPSFVSVGSILWRCVLDVFAWVSVYTKPSSVANCLDASRCWNPNVSVVSNVFLTLDHASLIVDNCSIFFIDGRIDEVNFLQYWWSLPSRPTLKDVDESHLVSSPQHKHFNGNPYLLFFRKIVSTYTFQWMLQYDTNDDIILWARSRSWSLTFASLRVLKARMCGGSRWNTLRNRYWEARRCKSSCWKS